MAKVVVFVCALLLTGCSSLAGTSGARRLRLEAYARGPDVLAVHEPRGLVVDQQLRALGLDAIAEPLVAAFDGVTETAGVIDQMRAHAPSLAPGRTVVFTGDSSALTDLPPTTPVLYVHATWQVAYRRLPPTFTMMQLELGVVAKVIPLGQVLQGRGPLAVRSAAWEANCHRKARGGEFVPVAEWTKDDGAMLRAAIRDLQRACGAQLGAALSSALP
jgi:hypothetical protein